MKTLTLNDYEKLLTFDENGVISSYKGMSIVKRGFCEKHGEIATHYGRDGDSWRLPFGCWHCFKEEHFERQLESALIPTRFKTKTFDNFEATEDWQAKALSKMISVKNDMDKFLDDGRCIVLFGGVGCGKTHLSCALCNFVLKNGKTAMFISVSRLIRKVRSSWGTGEEENVLKAFSQVDLLVIDEVGIQAGTDNEKNILFDVINERYNEIKSTIIISNLDQQGIKSFLGDRVWDRLKENGGFAIAFNGKSYRK